MDSVERVEADEEERVGVVGVGGGRYDTAGRIGKVDIHANVAERQVHAVMDDHVGIEGLAFKGEFLPDFDFDPGAQGVCRLCWSTKTACQKQPDYPFDAWHRLNYFLTVHAFLQFTTIVFKKSSFDFVAIILDIDHPNYCRLPR